MKYSVYYNKELEALKKQILKEGVGEFLKKNVSNRIGGLFNKYINPYLVLFTKIHISYLLIPVVIEKQLIRDGDITSRFLNDIMNYEEYLKQIRELIRKHLSGKISNVKEIEEAERIIEKTIGNSLINILSQILSSEFKRAGQYILKKIKKSIEEIGSGNEIAKEASDFLTDLSKQLEKYTTRTVESLNLKILDKFWVYTLRKAEEDEPLLKKYLGLKDTVLQKAFLVYTLNFLIPVYMLYSRLLAYNSLARKLVLINNIFNESYEHLYDKIPNFDKLYKDALFYVDYNLTSSDSFLLRYTIKIPSKSLEKLFSGLVKEQGIFFRKINIDKKTLDKLSEEFDEIISKLENAITEYVIYGKGTLAIGEGRSYKILLSTCFYFLYKKDPKIKELFNRLFREFPIPAKKALKTTFKDTVKELSQKSQSKKEEKSSEEVKTSQEQGPKEEVKTSQEQKPKEEVKTSQEQKPTVKQPTKALTTKEEKPKVQKPSTNPKEKDQDNEIGFAFEIQKPSKLEDEDIF